MMAGEDMVMVRQGELKRLHVIQKVLERVIKQVEARDAFAEREANSKDRQADQDRRG